MCEVLTFNNQRYLVGITHTIGRSLSRTGIKTTCSVCIVFLIQNHTNKLAFDFQRLEFIE